MSLAHHGEPRGSPAPDHGHRPRLIVHVTTVSLSLGFLRGQVAYMRGRGWRVATVSAPGPEQQLLKEEGAEITTLALERRIHPWGDLLNLLALIRLFRRLRPDVVHGHSPKGGLLALVAGVFTGVPVRIYHLRGLPHLSLNGLARRLVYLIERLNGLLAHEVLCISSSLGDYAIDRGLFAREKLTVLGHGSGNGVDALGRFNPDAEPRSRLECRATLGLAPDALVVIFAGRLALSKGIGELAAAWHDLRDEYPTAAVLLAGDIDEREPAAPEIMERLRRDPRVIFLGRVPDLRPLYRAADVLVLPSHREGFGNVLLEAASMNLPVIASDIPGCRDALIDGETGRLVPPHDPARLAQAIKSYLADATLRATHGQAGRARALRDFAPETIWRGIEGVYLRHLRR